MGRVFYGANRSKEKREAESPAPGGQSRTKKKKKKGRGAGGEKQYANTWSKHGENITVKGSRESRERRNDFESPLSPNQKMDGLYPGYRADSLGLSHSCSFSWRVTAPTVTP